MSVICLCLLASPAHGEEDDLRALELYNGGNVEMISAGRVPRPASQTAENITVVTAADIEYQAVLGRGWLSPWVEGAQFCGSRGMALPILGLRIRLRGDAAQTHDVVYSATFVDGSEAGPASNGEPCEAESLAALESFQVELRAKTDTASVADAPEAAGSEKSARKAGRKAVGGSRKR